MRLAALCMMGKGALAEEYAHKVKRLLHALHTPIKTPKSEGSSNYNRIIIYLVYK